MSNKAALQELETLLFTTLDPAPTKVYRRTQLDALTLLDEIQKGRVELPIVVLVVGRSDADPKINDAAADLRLSVDLYYIRPRALKPAEKTAGYSRIEDWGDDFVLQMRTILFSNWTTPVTVDEPYCDVTSANPVNTELFARFPQWYAVGCGTSAVVSPS